jgi:hypothetical protein
MKRHNWFAILLLCAAAMAAPTPKDTTARARLAEWLTARTGQAIAPAELLVYPTISDLSGCEVSGLRGAGTGRSELRMHCPGMALPQLVVLNCTADGQDQRIRSKGNLSTVAATPRLRHATLVRIGVHLQAELRSDSMRATLPVVALEGGDAGEIIRVRVTGNSRALRAQIVDAHSVLIVNGGA